MAFGGSVSPGSSSDRLAQNGHTPPPRRINREPEVDVPILLDSGKDEILSSSAAQTSPPSFRRFRYSVGNGGGIASSSSVKNRRSRSFGDDLDNEANPFEDEADVEHVAPDKASSEEAVRQRTATPPRPIPPRRPMQQSVSLPFVLKNQGRSPPKYGSQPLLSVATGELELEAAENPFEQPPQDPTSTPTTSFLAPNMPVPERGQSLPKPPLPPRPLSPNIALMSSNDGIRPPLPNRPLVSQISSSPPTGPPRYDSTGAPPPIPSRPQLPNRPGLETKKELSIVPDFSGPVNRNPPEPEFLVTREIPHKGFIRYDGRFLWAGLENGEIVCVDTTSGAVIDRKSVHSVAITHMLRYRGSLWSLDENGSLKLWEPDQTGNILLGSRPRNLRIGSRQEKAVIVEGKLWTSSGRSIDIYNPEETTSILQQKIDLGSITIGSLPVSNVTSMAVSPDASRVLTGHKSGTLILWDALSYSKLSMMKSSSYIITSIIYLPNDYIWVGYHTGKVHIFEVASEPWTVIKHFEAHYQTSVTDFFFNEKLYFHSGQMHVTSLSRLEKGDSSIKFWDGSLIKDWISTYMRKCEEEFVGYRSVRLFVGSWNIDANKPESLDLRPQSEHTILQWFLKLKDNPPEIIVINFQELVDLESKKVNAKQMLLDATAKHTGKGGHDHRFQLWHDRILRSLREHFGGVYRDLQSQQLVGLFQCVFLLERESPRCKVVSSARVKTGLGGFHGNKGGVATRLVLDDSSFCFLNCHLAAHQNQVEARNNDAKSIMDSMSFPNCSQLQDLVFMSSGDGSMILDHENVVIAGDLNYRIELPRSDVIRAVQQNNLKLLVEYDQLTKQRATNFNFGFRGFSEGEITFAPTFKYDIHSNQYDTSEKQRVPSWCDRILWRGSFTQHSYERVESTISDHRPVSATFSLPIKQIQPTKLEEVRFRAIGISNQRSADFLWRAKIEWIRQDEHSVVSFVTEYFSDSTSQARRRELEQNLESIRSHPDAVGLCHGLLQKENLSPYVEWFCFSVFEKAVLQGHKLEAQTRLSYRQFLWSLLSERHAVYKPFVLNTLIKSLTIMKIMDYQNEWPAFFIDIYDLRNSSLNLTLNMIKVVLEEFTSDRQDISSHRKSELKMALVQQSSSIIPFVTKLLSDVYESCISDSGHPFSSPTEKGGASIGIGLHSPLKTTSLWQLPIVGESPSRNNLSGLSASRFGSMGSLGNLDGEGIIVCTLCLNILLQLFSWCPLTENVIPAVDIVLKYCQLCDIGTVELGCLAMSIVNEILSRNYVPSEALTFVLSVAKQICMLLRRLTEEPGKAGSGKLDLEESYQSKFTDFLSSFVSHHIQRGEQIPDFPMGEFLILFYKYTFLQANFEAFVQCLHVWDTFVEYIIAQKAVSPQNGQLVAERYNGGLISLAKDILKKILMTENQKELSELSVERDEMENLSEWEKVSQSCIDLIAKITDLYPVDLLSIYFNLVATFGDRLLQTPSAIKSKIERESIVQDLSTVIRLFGQLSNQFTANFSISISAACSLLYKFSDILNHSLGKTGAGLPDSTLCLYIFGTLKLYIHWVELYYTHSLSSPEDLKLCKDLIARLIALCINSLSSPDTSVFGSRLLLSLAETVRPDLLHFPEIGPLLEKLRTQIPDLPEETTRNLYLAVTYGCIFPQNETRVTEQEWKNRLQSFCSLSGNLVASFTTLIAVIQQNQGISTDLTTKRQVKKMLIVFAAMFDCVATGNMSSKEVVAAGLQEVLALYSPLLSLFSFDADIFEAFLSFSLSVLKSLRRQLVKEGFQLVTETLQSFFKIMQSNAFVPLLRKKDGGGGEILDKFISFLGCIAEDSHKAFEGLLPDIIHFAVSGLFARLFEFEGPQVESAKTHYYDFLFKIVVNHQQYFFGSQIKHMAGRPGNDSTHDEELLGVLNALAVAMMDPNVEVFRQTLGLFDALNTKCVLFSRRIVQENFLVPFADMLLGILIQKSRNFMKDDIIGCISQALVCGNDQVKVENHCEGLSGDQQRVVAGYITAIKDESNVQEMVEAIVTDFTFFSHMGQ
ncbi:hypothetical protein HDU97_003961 [Phlyctochytrium planicorne]|nr:hypothetical protein HDU97_003961 [Phlyctochytrium planicorne]